jgi:hypothetical protein
MRCQRELQTNRRTFRQKVRWDGDGKTLGRGVFLTEVGVEFLGVEFGQGLLTASSPDFATGLSGSPSLTYACGDSSWFVFSRKAILVRGEQPPPRGPGKLFYPTNKPLNVIAITHQARALQLPSGVLTSYPATAREFCNGSMGERLEAVYQSVYLSKPMKGMHCSTGGRTPVNDCLIWADFWPSYLCQCKTQGRLGDDGKAWQCFLSG